MPYSQNIRKSDNSNLKELNEIIRLEKFLNGAGLKNTKLEAIPGDAGKRNYFRAHTYNNSFIIMDALQDKSAVAPFIKIANILNDIGLSTPKIHHISEDKTLLLLEDFGTFSYTKYLQTHPTAENELYDLAVDTLRVIYESDLRPELSQHTPSNLNDELAIFTEWYLKPRLDAIQFPKASEEFFNIFKKLYVHLEPLKPILSLKDFHADNLFYLPNRMDVKKVGIIDFQDALFSSPAHDLVSLLEDARRDVDFAVTQKSIERFSKVFQSKEDKLAFQEAYTITSIQRNLRIVGVFHRLKMRDNKAHYLLFLLRVYKYINNTLTSSLLVELNTWVKKYAVFD